MIMFNLIAVCEATHAGHDAEDVVVDCEHFEFASLYAGVPIGAWAHCA